MRIYYRGYVIDEEIPAISYSVHGPRPLRPELTAKTTTRQAMEWIDRDVKREAILAATSIMQPSAR